MKDFYKQLLLTAESAEIPVLSDEYCCELLAWLHVFGGFHEATTQDEILVSHIQTAQKRLNLLSGANYDNDLPISRMLQHKYAEIATYNQPTPYRNRQQFKCPMSIDWQNGNYYPDWVMKIFNKYHIKAPKPCI